MQYKIFCDESNHVHLDGSNVMLIGGIRCPHDKVASVNKYIKYLKKKHGAKSELKWTKLNSNKKDFYKELIDYFFDNEDLKFNCQLIINKQDLLLEGQPDLFYYKMYYYTLNNLLETYNSYNIFLDYKDTHGGNRVKKLKEILTNKGKGNYTLEFTIIHSHESQLMQMTDLFLGAIAYTNKNNISQDSEIKFFIMDYIEQKRGIPLNIETKNNYSRFRIYKFNPNRNIEI